MKNKEHVEMNVTQIMEQYQTILEEEVPQIARETGAVKRVRTNGLDAVTLVSSVIFGFWQDPDLTLGGLAQVAERRGVQVSESAISQRFTPACAELFLRVLKRLLSVTVPEEKVDIPLLKQFAAVVVEDSSTITLPAELAEYWQGCGKPGTSSAAGLKLFVRWNVLTGAITGPELTSARTSDHHSPFALSDLPPEALYLADLGFFSLTRLASMAHGQGGKRFFVTRWQPPTNLYTRSGHRLELHGLLPSQVGQVRDLGVVIGRRHPVAVRLLLVRVPEDVAKERQERLQRTSQEKRGREPSEEMMKLCHWLILLTNVPRRRADSFQVIVLLRLRWQIERLFRLWKEGGKIDEWRSCKPFRILCELYGKLCAMLLQHVLLQEGCWADPSRSILKAAGGLRREVNRLMVAFAEGGLAQTLASLLRCLRSGSRLNRRAAHPSTAQLLLEGLDWPLVLLT
jgi:hypothetical protein